MGSKPQMRAQLTEQSSSLHEQGEVSILTILNRVLRNRRLIIVTAAVGFLLMAALTLLAPRTYTSSGTFLPASRQAKSGLAALAAQYGVQMGADEPSQNADFFVDLIKSREILSSMARTRVELVSPAGKRTATIMDLLEVEGPTPQVRLERAVLALRGAIRSSAALKTGIVSFSVTLEDPALAAEVAGRVVDVLNRFNVDTRQSQAASERKFTEERMAEVRVNLRAAEDRLVDFNLRNRMAAASDIQMSADRLSRDVQRLHGLYSTLEQAYEQAKIDEVRDTPLLTPIDHAIAPIKPDPRGVVVKSLLGIVLGALLGFVIATVREQFKPDQNSATWQTEEYQEFSSLKTQTVADIRGLRHLLRRNGATTTSVGNTTSSTESSPKH